MGLIYKIANDINDKLYIGQTRTKLNIRLKNHKLDAKNNKYNSILHKAIRKYGWEHFNVEVLEDNIPLENLNERELYWTNYYNALAPNGYVLVAGQNNSKIISKETKLKMSKSHIGNKSNLGRKLSKETCKKMSKALIGNKHRSISVNQYDLNNNFIKKFESAKEAEKELNIYASSITRICRNIFGFKTAGGFIWRYK